MQGRSENYNSYEAEKGRAFAERQNLAQMKYNAEQAYDARKFEYAMSNTAYQRSMDDMRKAGLNPMLAYMQGGASTPPGSQASASSSSGPSASISTPSGSQARLEAPVGKGAWLGRGIQDAITNSIEMRRIKKELQQTDSQIAVNKQLANTQRTVQEYNKAQTAKSLSEKGIIDINKNIKNALIPTIQATAETQRRSSLADQSWFMVWFNKLLDRIPFISRTAVDLNKLIEN